MLIRGNARDLRRVDGSKTLEQRALAVIRSLGGDAIYVQNGFPRLWTDSAGTTPVTAVGDVIGRAVGRTGLITATRAVTANKPVIGRVPTMLGPELVSNGSFDSDISGWTVTAPTTATWTASGMQVTRNGAANTNARQAVSLVAGKTYLASIDVTTTPTVANGGFLYIASADGSVVRYIDGTAQRNTVGNVSATFTATVTENALVFVGQTGFLTGTVTVDNVSVKEVINTSNAISFDATNDALTFAFNSTSLTVRTYTTTGTITTVTSSTSSQFVLGQTLMENRNVVLVVAIPSGSFSSENLALLDRFAVMLGATL